jgi:hypothetical protein
MRMTTRTSQLLGLIVLPILGGCASGGALVKKSVSIERGNSKDRVVEILGAPGDRQFREDDEAWQYCRTNYTGIAADQYVVVWFYQGKVTGVTTYRNTQFGTCSSFFKTIRWEDAPDRTIEIRPR